jgi:serine/threonine-protein kinase
MGLTSAQMARMSRLLDEALPLDEAGRRAWLDALASEHQDIAAALHDALLPNSAETNDPLVTLPKVGADDERVSAAASELGPGSRVGPYELIKPLGAGGMAEVWLARRADGAFKREVALKLPMLTRLRKDLEERFARERDILASLEHPNIARLYDAGTDSNGLPYLSMEYVAGQPITNWCDAHKLAILERLRLLLQVLDGVQYAHERQVIHRDLKPSNILVSESGQVRLLDFGIAKLLRTEEADRTQLTSVYGRALTPDYASPELLRGDTVDARSDVYSLGVLIYELLTGARPYRLKAGASLATLEQAIATVEVSKPSAQIEPQSCESRAVTQEKLVRLLRGDLDVIVLKALDKEPDQRYASAATLAEDVRRPDLWLGLYRRSLPPVLDVGWAWVRVAAHDCASAAECTMARTAAANNQGHGRALFLLPCPTTSFRISFASMVIS